MIHVIAVVEAREGARNALIEAFHGVIPYVRAKEGCLEYDLAVHVESGLEGQEPFDENTVTIVEKWASLDILRAHLNDPKFRDWFSNAWSLMAGASMQVLEAT